MEVKRDSPKTRAAKSAGAKAAATVRRKAVAKASVARPSRQIGGFMAFVREQGVVGLAIGLVIGTQVKTLVDQLVISFVNPIVGLVLPGQGDLAKKMFTITIRDKTAVFNYGAFIAVLISFLTVAAVIYYIVKALKLDKLDKKKES